MAILVDWYENPLPGSESAGNEKSVAFHPRLSGNGLLSDKQVIEQLCQRNGISAAAVAAVLQGLSDLLMTELADGKQVHVPGIGYFKPSLKATERITRNTPRKVEKVKVDGICFKAEKQLTDKLSQANVQRTKNPISSQKHDEESIEEGMRQLFSENRFVTRMMIQDKFQMTLSTTSRLVKRLLEEHKLVNVGSKNSPIYQAEVGYYS